MRVLFIFLFLITSFNALGQSGTLDETFGIGGKVIMPVGERDDRGELIAILPNGNFITSGWFSNEMGQSIHDALYLSKHLANGDLDLNFGNNGIITDTIGNSGTIISNIAIQEDGKIVAVGRTQNSSGFVVLLLRFNPDGSYDESFGESGIVSIQISTSTLPSSLSILPDGKIIVAVSVYDGVGSQFCLLKFTSTGILDESFGSNGVVISSVSPYLASLTHEMAVTNEGKIIVVGSTFTSSMEVRAIIVRYESNGNLDVTFGNAGTVIETLGDEPGFGSYSDVYIQPDGKIIAVGHSESSIDGTFFSNVNIIAKYNSDGSLDQNFGNAGIVPTIISEGNGRNNAVVMQPDGKIVVVGSASAPFPEWHTYFACLRYTNNGDLDQEFGTNGIFTTDVSPYDIHVALNIALQPDGKLLLIGITTNENGRFDVGLIRLHSGLSIGLEDELKPFNQINVFPNPASETIRLKTSKDQDLQEVAVYDALGRSVLYQKNIQSSRQINISQLRSGIYILKAIFNDGKVAQDKFVVHR